MCAGFDYPPAMSLVKPGALLGFADPPLPEDCRGDIPMLLAQASGHRSRTAAHPRRHCAKGHVLVAPLVTFNVPMGTAVRSNLFIKSQNSSCRLETFAATWLLLRAQRQIQHEKLSQLAAGSRRQGL